MEINPDKLTEFFFSKPDEALRMIEEAGVDFEEARSELDVGRNLVRERWSVGNQSIHAVEFVFWISYYIEREIRSLIIEPEVKVGARKLAIEKIVDKLHFGDKISIISDLYITNPKKDEFIKLVRKIQDLRNDVAHGRFDNLNYSDYSLSNLKGQIKLIIDLRNSLLLGKEKP